MWRVRFQAPPETVEAFETALDPLMDAFLCFEIEGSTDWQFDSYKAEKPDLPALHAAVALAAQVAGLDAIPELEIEHQAARNWLAENLTAFPPIRAGRFYVYGSHIEDPIPHG
jgi:ribosomal protein L11 methyltransferase